MPNFDHSNCNPLGSCGDVNTWMKIESRSDALNAIIYDGMRPVILCDRYKSDKECMLAALANESYDLQYASPALKNDKAFLLIAAEIDGYCLHAACKLLQADKEVVMTAVKNKGCAIQFACASLKGDKDIARAAMQQDAFATVFISDELRADKEFILEEVKKDGLILNYAINLQADYEVALAAVQNNGHALAFVSDENLVNKKIVQAALHNKSDAIKDARVWADIKYRQLDHHQQYMPPTVADNKEHTKRVTLLNSLAEKILEQEKAVAMYDSPFF